MSKREAFLQATGKDTIQDFLDFIKLHKDASDPFDLEEILQELPRKQKEELWQKLNTLLMDTLVANPVESWHKMDEESDDDMEVEEAPEVKNTMDVIHGVTIVATLSVAVVEEDMGYQSLLECAGLLNGILEALPRPETEVRFAIQELCEAWWEKGLEKKEEFGKTAFSMILAKSLAPKGLGADVVRLWNFHPALLSFDYNAEDSSEVKDLLLKCFLSIIHIKKEEGRRFLSFIFSWDVNFIKVIHGTIKNQLHSLPKSLMCHVADVYFRAWKKASDDFQTTIEHTCIQDYMHHGVHLPRKSIVHLKVREILSYLHQQKMRQGVEEMLCRLYQPIIWRGLKAPNSEVRSNAAILFVQAFPLRNPSMSHADIDNEIQKQFGDLLNLLEDPQPVVRSTGILGVCQITAKYWEMIPPAILADLMRKILGDLASDISSADVRCSVFKSLNILLENKLSHPLLEQMLPSLKYSLHDNAEKVRVAVVNMLLKIKATRAAKFWKICPMDHLLARLEVDSRPVCRRIVNLIFSSFFPVNEPEEVWCERCVALIQMNPGAARRFYQYAYEHTAPTNIAKLMLTIRRCLNSCLRKTLRSENEENEEDNENEESERKNKSVLESVLSNEDIASTASLLEIIVILWRSVRKALDENVEAKNYTISKFACVLPEYFRVFKDDRCTVPLIIMASFMPPSSVPTFSCSVLSKLRNLNNEAEENKYSSLIDCLCRWGQVGHLLELIIDWLHEALPDKKKRKDSTRKVRIQDTMECKPDLAFKYIEYLMTEKMNRECLLSTQTNKLNNLFKQLGLVKDVLYSFMNPSEGVTPTLSQENSLRAFSLYCRLSIHLQYKLCSEGRMYLSVLEDIGGWIESQVLGGAGDSFSEHQNEMAQQILQTYLTVCKDVIMVGLGDSDFQAQLLQILLAIMQTEKCCDCLPIFLSVLKEITEACLPLKMNNASADVDKHLDAIQTCFHKAIEISARKLRKQQDEALQLLDSIQVPILQFVNIVQCWQMASIEVHRGVLSTIIAAVVVEMSHALRKISDPEEIVVPASIAGLPSLSRCLMSVVTKTYSVLNSFLGELATCVSAEDIEGIISLTACLHIVTVSSKGKSMSAAAKDIVSTIYRKLKNYREVTMEDDENIERAIYESSMRTLDQLLQP